MKARTFNMPAPLCDEEIKARVHQRRICGNHFRLDIIFDERLTDRATREAVMLAISALLSAPPCKEHDWWQYDPEKQPDWYVCRACGDTIQLDPVRFGKCDS